ncbi:MAG: Gldg family protein [Myxococcota bacterium]|nr:Gldg family protein [Myxococcota bacterium]
MSAPTPLPTVGGLRLPGLLYLGGLLVIFLGERVVGGLDTTRFILDGVGGAMVAGALGLFAKSRGDAAEDQKPAHQVPLIYGALGVGALLVYVLGIDAVVDALGFSDEETEHRYGVAVAAVWPVVLLAGVLPMLAADRVLAASPVRVVADRVRGAALAALSLAFALAMLFPLNYLASETNERWDFGYFKTARPGTSTVSMVQSLEEPITAYLFFPTASDVTEELKTYFSELGGQELIVEYVDHALEPDLAKDLKVRDNGYIAFVRGEGEEQQVERVKVGKDFESARRKLKKLDNEVRGALLKMARGQKVAYFTAGHGELYWGAEQTIDRKTSSLRKMLRALNYKVEELTLADGSAVEIPEDASLVVMLGAESALLPEELSALDAYRRRGGSLLVGLEPGGADLSALLKPLGIGTVGDVVLANDSKFVPATRRPIDRANVFTDKFSTHPSVTTLSRNSRTMAFIISRSVALEDLGSGDGKRTVTIRSMADTWGDRNGNYAFDSDTEERKTWNVAMAASGDAEGAGEDAPPEWRVVVTADATWASDLALPLDPNKANFQYVLDAVSWLGHDDALAGTVNSEEDVKIEHNKEGQGWIFYSTSAFGPLGLLGLGLVRLRVRRKRGAA